MDVMWFVHEMKMTMNDNEIESVRGIERARAERANGRMNVVMKITNSTQIRSGYS